MCARAGSLLTVLACVNRDCSATSSPWQHLRDVGERGQMWWVHDSTLYLQGSERWRGCNRIYGCFIFYSWQEEERRWEGADCVETNGNFRAQTGDDGLEGLVWRAQPHQTGCDVQKAFYQSGEILFFFSFFFFWHRWDQIMQQIKLNGHLDDDCWDRMRKTERERERERERDRDKVGIERDLLQVILIILLDLCCQMSQGR